jgi:hypothetical protein
VVEHHALNLAVPARKTRLKERTSLANPAYHENEAVIEKIGGGR